MGFRVVQVPSHVQVPFPPQPCSNHTGCRDPKPSALMNKGQEAIRKPHVVSPLQTWLGRLVLMLCALLGRHSLSSSDASCQRRPTRLEANCWWRSRASMHVQISTEGFVRRVPWLSLLLSDSGNSSIRTVEPRYGIFTTDCVTSKRGGRPGATQRWRVAKRKLRPTHMAAFNQIWFMGRRDFCWNLPKSGKDQKSGRTGQSKRPHASWRRVLRRTQARRVRNESLVARAKNLPDRPAS